jgi:hypothetical protein
MKARRRIAAPKAQGCANHALEWRNYSRDLRPEEWGPNVILHGNNPDDRMSALGQKQTSEATPGRFSFVRRSEKGGPGVRLASVEAMTCDDTHRA